MLTVPLYLIWRLQTSIKRKIGISAIFGTGLLYVPPFHFFGPASRLIFLQRVYIQRDAPYLPDQTQPHSRLLVRQNANRPLGVNYRP